MTSRESDEVLHARVREGDMDAFDALYARYEGPLLGFIRGQLRNRSDAEEVFHDVFLKALRDPTASLSEAGAFRAWLYCVARNAALNRQRSGRRSERAMAQLPDAEPSRAVDAVLAERDLHAALNGAVHRLPRGLSELYHLRSSGLSYEEIARVLEVPIGTVKSRMHQMVTTLREEMLPWIAR